MNNSLRVTHLNGSNNLLYETSGFNYLFAFDNFQPFLKTRSVKVLADLFHMNIEEDDLAAAIRAGGQHIGHIHFVDSNRKAAGMGHLDFGTIASAIQHIGFTGYLSAEAFPLLDSQTCAAKTMETYLWMLL